MKTATIFAVLIISIILATAAVAQTPPPSPEPSTTTTTATTTTTDTTATTTISTTTTSISTSTTTTTTQSCVPEYSSGVLPVQGPYVDDQQGSSDLEGAPPLMNVHETFPMIQDRKTTLVGREIDGYLGKASMKPCEKIKGKFVIEITGAAPAEYETVETFTIDPATDVLPKIFSFNPPTSDGAVSSIPFVPDPLRTYVPGTSQIHWTPTDPFKWNQGVTASEITVKFKLENNQGEIELGKTIVEKIISTKKLTIEWKPLILDGDLFSQSGAQELQQIFTGARSRSTNEQVDENTGKPPAALFIQANYPVEDGKFTSKTSTAAKAVNPSFVPIVCLPIPSGKISTVEWDDFSDQRKLFNLKCIAASSELSTHQKDGPSYLIYVGGGFGWAFNSLLTQTRIGGPSFSAYDEFKGGHVWFIDYTSNFEDDSLSRIIEAHQLGHANPFLLSDDNPAVTVKGYLSTLDPMKMHPARPASGAFTSSGFMKDNIDFPPNSILIPDDVMKRDFVEHMTRRDHYKNVLIPAMNEREDPPVVLLRGILVTDDQNAITGLTVLPVNTLAESTPDQEIPCNGETNCITLFEELTLADNNVVIKALGIRTNPVAGRTENYAVVADAIAVPTSAPIASLRIKDSGNNVLFEKQVSANTPTVTIKKVKAKLANGTVQILYSAGSDPDDVNDPDPDFNLKKLKIVVKGTDANNDTMYASLYLITPENTLEEIETDKQLVDGKAKFIISGKLLTPGDYKARAILTDGFNTVQQEVPFHLPSTV